MVTWQGGKRRIVSTILMPAERLCVDAAGVGCYTAFHHDRAIDVVTDIRLHGADAIVVSVNHCEQHEPQQIARLVRELPRVPTIGLLSQVTTRTPRVLLELGGYGIAQLVDTRSSEGWKDLRNCLMDQTADPTETMIMKALQAALPQMCQAPLAFFEQMVRMSQRLGSVCGLCQTYGILPSTLMSRFFRAGLPAPKRYLAMVRLIRAAYLFENPGLSVANVANHLEYSSPQSFGRHIRAMMGMSAVEFRAQYSAQKMIDGFIEDMIEPYRGILKTFEPLPPAALT
jgi:AraC-like DNA-binding protein